MYKLLFIMYSNPDKHNTELTPVIFKVSLKEHLTNLEAAENLKPPSQRRHVPTLAELSQVAGVTRQGMYTFADSDSKMVNLKTLSTVISELRRLGFATALADILTPYRTSSEEE